MGLLEQINSPADLKGLTKPELSKLACELREYIVQSVSKTGGHLSSNLGTVELAVALHAVFDAPKDSIIWDVGHQCYAHKILTGRREAMAGLRQYGGMAGFPKRDESEYDAFGTAHSSTSISAALGMAVANAMKGSDAMSVAVIGDGAMTGGMAFEAMNNVAMHKNTRLLVILNDNDMSISHPVGALNRYFASLMSGNFYAAAKNVGKTVLKGPLLDIARKVESQAKSLMTPATLFETFGFNYVGPVDGHDMDCLLETLGNLKNRTTPQFLHIVTKKGYGYKLAEKDPVGYHGTGRFEPSVGIRPATGGSPTYSAVFGQWLCDTAEADKRLVAVTPAMGEGSGMTGFEKRFKERFFDVGIAEQHAVTFAAAMACEGLKPVVAIYSTFLQRGYDQLIHDVALQNLDVTFAIDRAGLVGADGPTHAGSYDIAYLRCIPNVTVMTPSDEAETRKLLSTAWAYEGPACVRYPRGKGPGAKTDFPLETVPFGKANVLRRGKACALLAFGPLAKEALAVAEKLGATAVDMRFVKPLDTALIDDIAETHEAIVTLEEGCIAGGAGSAVSEYLHSKGILKPVLMLGLPDAFIEHGDVPTLMRNAGLDEQGILRTVTERFAPLFG